MSCDDSQIDCAKVLDRVYDFLDNELDGRSLSYAEIESHLGRCGPCLAKYDLERVVRELLARSCACEHAPDELRARVLDRIRDAKAQISRPIDVS